LTIKISQDGDISGFVRMAESSIPRGFVDGANWKTRWRTAPIDDEMALILFQPHSNS